MALIQITGSLWRRALYRPLLNGPPLSGKTTSTKTFPRRSLSKSYQRNITGDTFLVVVPGEHGHTSVLPEDDYHIFAWEIDPTSATNEYKKWWVEFESTLREIVTGKHGPVETLVIDGLHLLYDLVMRVNGWTPAMVDDKESGRQYTKYHADFLNFVSKWLQSPVPMVAATCFDGLEPMESDNPRSLKQIYPSLPGMMAKRIMGVFPVIIHTEGQQGDVKSFKWALRPLGKTQAAGMHLPQTLAEKFPRECPQDWLVLDQVFAQAIMGMPEAPPAASIKS